MDIDQLQLEDVDDEEKKLQGNIAHIFSQALNFTSSLIRYTHLSGMYLTASNEWFELRDRLLQERVQR